VFFYSLFTDKHRKELIPFCFVCFLQQVEQPFDCFEENGQFRRAPPLVRVEKMFEHVQSKLPGAPKFLLCLLPERKNSDLYGSFVDIFPCYIPFCNPFV
jgi:hypothetical protein